MKITIRLLPVLIVLTILMSSCKHDTDNDHIPAKVMQKVLLDINLAEAYSSMKKDSLHRMGTKNTDSLAVYYKDIFAHYHITEAAFEQSLTWYRNNPDDLDSIYTQDLQTSTRWQANQPPIKPAVQPKKDTLAIHDTLADKKAIIIQRRRRLMHGVAH